MSSVRIFLKKGREKKIKHFYPWVFKDDIERIEGNGIIGELFDSEGNFLAVGSFSERSKVAFRVLSYEKEDLNVDFFKRRFLQALRLRRDIPSTAYRLAFSESDLLSGLIVDRYNEGFVLQVRTFPMEELKPLILNALEELFSPAFIYERSDFRGRREEGLKEFKGLLRGKLENPFIIEENGFRFFVDVERGLKTGFYLDQRENRAYISELLRGGERVLDLFCYTGGFSVYCASKGARVTGVDINEEAIELAKKNAELNGVKAEFITANAFDFLENTEEIYDLIIADPPAIAKTKKEKESILWAVWKLAFYSIARLRPLGRLFICTCTYQISAEEMIRQVRLAATDRGRRVIVKEIRLQPKDHPYLPTFPESLYLKCLDLIVLD